MAVTRREFLTSVGVAAGSVVAGDVAARGAAQRGSAASSDRELIFTAGWHGGVNFAIGTQVWKPGSPHYLYSYNMSSKVDELYDLASDDAENLARRSEYKSVRHEMINRLGQLLQKDPRWLGYWSSFRLDRFFDLPLMAGDQQLLEPRYPG